MMLDLKDLNDIFCEYTDFISTFYFMQDNNFVFILDNNIHNQDKIFSNFLDYKEKMKDSKK